MTQKVSFSTHLRDTFSQLQILLLHSECQSHLQPCFELKYSNSGKGLWPFLLVMKVVRQFHYMCNFQSDFLVLKDRLPRLAVIADIPPPEDGPAEGYCRLMLQGACVVRFANTYLEAYKDERNFVFMAIFIDDFGYADRYLLYQTKGSDIVRMHNGLWNTYAEFP
jgi:hypothetical protein